MTGGAGFIGSHLVDQLILTGHEVIVVDNLSTGTLRNINAKAQLNNIDVTDMLLCSAFEKCGHIDAVVHFAAQPSVAVSWKCVFEDAHVNIGGTVNVLDCCRRYGVGHIVFASSAAIYGHAIELPITEDTLTAPMSPYAAAKLSAEEYIKMYGREYGINTCIMRFANVYGPRQNASGESGVVSIFASALVSGQPVRITGDGLQTRDFIYVADVAAAVLRSLAARSSGVYNISTNSEISVADVFRIMCKAADANTSVIWCDESPGDVRNSRLDNQLAKNQLGWEPLVAFEDGVRATIRYFQLASNRSIT